MIELLVLCLIFYLGYQAGFMVTAWRLREILYDEAVRQGLVETQPGLPKVAQLFVEKANNVLYLYDRDSDSFVCQGSSIEELATIAKEKCNIKYAAVKIDDKIYAFVDGLVKTENEVLP